MLDDKDEFEPSAVTPAPLIYNEHLRKLYERYTGRQLPVPHLTDDGAGLPPVVE